MLTLVRFGWDGDMEIPKRSLRETIAEGMMPEKRNDGTVHLTNRIRRRTANKKLAGVYRWLEDLNDAP